MPHLLAEVCVTKGGLTKGGRPLLVEARVIECQLPGAGDGCSDSDSSGGVTFLGTRRATSAQGLPDMRFFV